MFSSFMNLPELGMQKPVADRTCIPKDVVKRSPKGGGIEATSDSSCTQHLPFSK